MKPALILGAALSGAAVLGFYAVRDQSEEEGLPYLDAQTTREGKALYGDYCAACHGADLQGQADWRVRDADGFLPAPPHDATGHTWHHPDSQLIAITERGTARIVGGGYQSNMEGFQEVLSRAEIVAILAYIKSTWPQEVIDTHNRINAEAEG